MTTGKVPPTLAAQLEEDNQSFQPAKYCIYSIEQAFRHVIQPRSASEQQLYMIVDDVLYNVWDACCLSISEGYREEYLPYLPHVFDLLCKTEDGFDVYDYLVFIEKTKYSMFQQDTLTSRKAAQVVEMLLEYRQKILAR